MTLQQINFDTILPIWRHHLWPQRQSPIEAVSMMRFLGGIDMTIGDNRPTFFGMFDGATLVGVNSGFRTAAGLYRSRGIYVMPTHRGRGIAQELLHAVMTQAAAEDCSALWSIPRQTAAAVYYRFGFIQITDWFSDGMESGPNCYVVKQVK